MRVLIVGPYGGANLGDEFILSQIAGELGAAGHDVTVASADPAWTERVHGLPSIRALDIKRRRFGALKAIAGFDALVVGGGEQLQEGRIGHGGYPIWGLLPNVTHYVRAADRRDIPAMLWGVGVEHIKTPFGRWMISREVRKAHAATVRDQASYGRLRTLGFGEDQLLLAADPVFAVPRADRGTARQYVRDTLNLSGKGPILMLSPANDGRTGLGYLAAVVDGCRRALRPRNGTLVLFLMDHQPRYDRVLLSRPELLPDDTIRHAPLMEFSPTFLPQMFAGVDAVIAARMHALILASTQGTPWVNLSRSVKMDALSDMLGVQPLTVANLTAERVERAVTHALDTTPAAWQTSHDLALSTVRTRVGISGRLFDERVGNAIGSRTQSRRDFVGLVRDFNPGHLGDAPPVVTRPSSTEGHLR